MTLAEFLLARITEDEELAQSATPGPWEVLPVRDEPMDESDPITEWQLCGDARRHGNGVGWAVPGEYHVRVLEVDKDGHSHYDPVEQLGHPSFEHAARWDPIRVIAECAVKRRIVAMHIITSEPAYAWTLPSGGEWLPTGALEYGCSDCDLMENNDQSWDVFHNRPISGCSTLRILALPYADHPDYDPAWKV